jgi:hypothetical protein
VQEDLILIKSATDADPDLSVQQGVLDLHLMLEHARQVRVLLTYVLALLGVPIWLTAALPTRVPHGVRTLSLYAWAIGLLCLVFAVISERRLHRKRAVLLQKLGSPNR